MYIYLFHTSKNTNIQAHTIVITVIRCVCAGGCVCVCASGCVCVCGCVCGWFTSLLKS